MGNASRLMIAALGAGMALLMLAYFVYLGGNVLRSGQTGSQEQKLRLANLARSCESSVGSDGYGSFSTDRQIVVSDEEGTIDVPCKIVLERGGSLTLDNVQLRGKHFAIGDLQPNGESRLQITASTLTGEEGSGFVTKLSDSSDSINISNSTLDYPLAVWATAGDVSAGGSGGGSISVSESAIRSLDERGDGIQLAVSDQNGTGVFTDVDLEAIPLHPSLDPRIKKITLLAGQCRMEGVRGYEGACDPSDAARARNSEQP